jgi:sugar-specific transcriptional regulator TrmB
LRVYDALESLVKYNMLEEKEGKHDEYKWNLHV